MSFKNIIISSCVITFLVSKVSGYAQHPGAYSSPHYAKKSSLYSHQYDQPSPYSEPEYQKISQSDQYSDKQPNAERTKHHEIELSHYAKKQGNDEGRVFETSKKREVLTGERQEGVIDGNDVLDYGVGNETHSGRSSGFMATAGSFLNGRGGQMLADIARELISRSTGASSQVGPAAVAEVLSLNLTNLVILVLLKALLLAAGMFGAGAWNHGYARSLEGSDNSLTLSTEEMNLWSAYFRLQDGGGPACLTLAACESPSLAKRYSSGADILLTTVKLMHGTIAYEKYERVLEEMKRAASWGAAGMECASRYKKCTKT